MRRADPWIYSISNMALFQQQLGRSGLPEELRRSKQGASPQMGHERDRAGPSGAGRGWAGLGGTSRSCPGCLSCEF